MVVPWLYGTIYESCLEHIERQDCPVNRMPTFYTPPTVKYDHSTFKNRAKKPKASAANVNKHIAEFLKTDATHMWMIDADCEVPPHALCELLKLDVDIASGVTFCHKEARLTTAGRWYDSPTPQYEWSKPYFKFLTVPEIFGKILKTPIHVGTGAFCLLCRRRVFEPFHEAFKPIRFRWDEPQKYSIDLQFWKDAQMFGFTGAIHGGIICGHLPEYPLKTLETFDWI